MIEEVRRVTEGLIENRPIMTSVEKQSPRSVKSVNFFAAIVIFLLVATSTSDESQSKSQKRSVAAYIEGPLVVSENWPECTDLHSWMRDIMRLENAETASETAQAKVFFRWLRLFSKMATGGMIQAHEGPYGDEQYVIDAHKNLFVYGWGYCDTHSRIAEAAWSEYKKSRGFAERVVVQHQDGGYHTMYRLKLDGHFSGFDARYGYYLIDHDAADGRVLDWNEVGIDQNILANKSYVHRSQPFFEYFGKEWERALLLNPVYYASEDEWHTAGNPAECVFGNGQYELGTFFHDMSFRLSKGTTIERFWDNTARKFYVPRGFESSGEEPFKGSGRFYRVTDSMFDGNWARHDLNYKFCAPYLRKIPLDEGYNSNVRGGRSIGQAWGRLTYEPDLSRQDSLESVVETDLVHSREAPFLRPSTQASGGKTIFDFYNPYIWVDGLLNGEWISSPADGARVEIRVLQPKRLNETEPDRWSSWKTLSRSSGKFQISLGREKYNGDDLGIHGVYRFQLRFSLQPNSARSHDVGLVRLRLETYFENGIMSIPRIIDGTNVIHFKLREGLRPKGPISVSYRYQTASGERSHEQNLNPGDFQNSVATYRFRAAGLIRCNSLKVVY